jgi:predicted MFS family arabinose efflux permease
MSVTCDGRMEEARVAWGGVGAMALCVAVLIASEFMPLSLLSPIAADLDISEGRAGQAIAVSGAFAVLTSLSIAGGTRRLDRRTVMLALTAILVGSGLVVTLAPNHGVLMLGRALLGVAIGGFWSLSIAIVMRLLPAERVPEGLSMLNAAAAAATTVAAPLGSLLGAGIGWRGAFFLVVPLGLLALAWQWIALPKLEPRRGRGGAANAFALLRRPAVLLGMAAILFLFMGQFALFTYLRPFLEQVTRLELPALSTVLLAIGLAGVAGTWLAARLLRRHLFSLLVGIPLAMAALAVALIAFGAEPAPACLLLAAWGFFATAAPVGWGTWLSRTMPEEAEVGGGLQVAVIQLAITLGAGAGGVLFDAVGWWSAFALAAGLLCLSSLSALAVRRTTRI